MGIFDFFKGVLKEIKDNQDNITKTYHRNRISMAARSLLIEDGNFKDGEEDGLWKYYYENGNIEREGNWEKSKMTGLWKYYYENGNIEREGNWEKSKMTGLWKEYDSDGKLQKEINYDGLVDAALIITELESEKLGEKKVSEEKKDGDSEVDETDSLDGQKKASQINLEELLNTIKNSPGKVKIKVEHTNEFKGWYQTQNNLSVINNKDVKDYDFNGDMRNCLNMWSSDKRWEKAHGKSPIFNKKKKIFFGKYTCKFTGLVNLTKKGVGNSLTIIETIQELLDSNKQSIDSLYEVLYERGNELYGMPNCGQTLEESISLDFEALKYEVFENGKEKNLITFDDYQHGGNSEWKLKIIYNSVLLEENKDIEKLKALINPVIPAINIELMTRLFMSNVEQLIEEPTDDVFHTIVDDIELKGKNKKSREAMIPCNYEEYKNTTKTFITLLWMYKKKDISKEILLKSPKRIVEELVSKVYARINSKIDS